MRDKWIPKQMLLNGVRIFRIEKPVNLNKVLTHSVLPLGCGGYRLGRLLSPLKPLFHELLLSSF